MTEPKSSSTESNATQTVSDKTLRQFMGYNIKRASNAIQADLTLALKEHDLRMLTFTALVLVRDNPGLSQTQLAAAMDIERPNLVVVVDELERRDLITRDRVPTDRRTYALNVTPSGETLYSQAMAAVAAHEDRLLRNVTGEMRDVIVRASQTIIKTAKQE